MAATTDGKLIKKKKKNQTNVIEMTLVYIESTSRLVDEKASNVV